MTERIKEVLTGASASIVVRTYGPNLDQLRATAQEISAAMQKVEGVSSLHVETQTLVPQLRVNLRSDAATRVGLTSGALMRSVTTLVNGTLVGEIYEEQKFFGVVVRGERELCTDVTSLQRLLIDTPSDAQVPLGDVADVTVVPTPNEIQREGASRRIDVTCNASGRDLGRVAREIEYPMALVILGGLVTSTLLNLFVLPVAFGVVGKGAVNLAEEHDIRISMN